jgi:hypothetical protein
MPHIPSDDTHLSQTPACVDQARSSRAVTTDFAMIVIDGASINLPRSAKSVSSFDK